MFLGAVAVGSFAVHLAVVSNTSWVDDFLQGKELGSGDEMAAAEYLKAPEATQASYGLDLPDGGQEITVILPDGTMAKAILQPNDVLAAN